MKLVGTVLLVLALTGCGSISGGTSSPIVPDKTVHLTSKIAVPLGDIATTVLAGALIYFIYDPLAPNWEIEQARLSEDTFHFDLRMKRYHTGGAGESMQILRRRAGQLQRQLGYTGYELLEYTEGVDSQTLGAKRYAEATVRLVRRQAAVESLVVSAAPESRALPKDQSP